MAESLIPKNRITRSILELRGQRVLLDTDLAELYGVETGALNQADLLGFFGPAITRKWRPELLLTPSL